MRAEARQLGRRQRVLMHAALVVALRERDPAAAREALAEDIQQAADHIEGTGRLASS